MVFEREKMQWPNIFLCACCNFIRLAPEAKAYLFWLATTFPANRIAAILSCHTCLWFLLSSWSHQVLRQAPRHKKYQNHPEDRMFHDLKTTYVWQIKLKYGNALFTID